MNNLFLEMNSAAKAEPKLIQGSRSHGSVSPTVGECMRCERISNMLVIFRRIYIDYSATVSGCWTPILLMQSLLTDLLLAGIFIGLKHFLNNYSHMIPVAAQKKVERREYLFECIKVVTLGSQCQCVLQSVAKCLYGNPQKT